MRSAEVILDIPTQALDAPYTYAVPSDMDEVDVGCAVLVPLGARKAIGFVMSLGQAEEAQRFDVVVDGFAFDPDAAGGLTGSDESAFGICRLGGADFQTGECNVSVFCGTRADSGK